MKSIWLLLLSAFSSFSVASAATHEGGEARLSPVEIRNLTEAHSSNALTLFREFLNIPNDANHPENMLQILAWLEPAFEARGFTTTRIETGGSPILFAERLQQNAEKTVLIYLQSDGQPVDPTVWAQSNPYVATLKELGADGVWNTIPWEATNDARNPDWRIFARSASDSKGPIIQFLVALDAMNDANIEPDFDIKVVVDTEEELGSPNLPNAVRENRELLAADLLLIFDGPPHASNLPTVKFGARGIMTMKITTHGPRLPQHSGHYGNYAPNPAFHLSKILASMKSQNGRVRIAGYYDGVSVSDSVKKTLAEVPDNERLIQEQLGFSRPDAVADSLQESLQYPSLNIRGMQSGWVGNEARTIIPAKATAELDIRLVVESDPQRIVSLIHNHIAELGYFIVDREPTEQERQDNSYIVEVTHEFAYDAFRSNFDSPPGLLARAGLQSLYGKEPILIRTSGGSIPISPFVQTLGVPAASVPTVNIDNNQHSPNENIRFGNFLEGISMLIAVLSQPVK